MFLVVVIPVYNEAKTIIAVLDEHVQRLGVLQDWEILCLDDASEDQSWELLKAYAAHQPRLRLLRHETNQGISISFQRLFEEAKGDFLYATAADGQWPAENLTRLLKACQESHADLVVGVRENRQQVYSIFRRALSYGFNWMTKVYLQDQVEDINGIKLGRRDIFLQPVRSKSFFAEVERLKAAKQKGYTIVQAPVIFLPRLHGKPSGAKLGNILATLVDFIKGVVKWQT